MSGYVCIWEFLVRPEQVDAFEDAYGPEGEWTALFRRSPAFVSTSLLRDKAQQNRYLTIDRWLSERDYAEFRARYEGEYRAIDQRLERLTLEERMVGSYDDRVAEGSTGAGGP